MNGSRAPALRVCRLHRGGRSRGARRDGLRPRRRGRTGARRDRRPGRTRRRHPPIRPVPRQTRSPSAFQWARWRAREQIEPRPRIGLARSTARSRRPGLVSRSRARQREGSGGGGSRRNMRGGPPRRRRHGRRTDRRRSRRHIPRAPRRNVHTEPLRRARGRTARRLRRFAHHARGPSKPRRRSDGPRPRQGQRRGREAHRAPRGPRTPCQNRQRSSRGSDLARASTGHRARRPVTPRRQRESASSSQREAVWSGSENHLQESQPQREEGARKLRAAERSRCVPRGDPSRKNADAPGRPPDASTPRGHRPRAYPAASREHPPPKRPTRAGQRRFARPDTVRSRGNATATAPSSTVGHGASGQEGPARPRPGQTPPRGEARGPRGRAPQGRHRPSAQGRRAGAQPGPAPETREGPGPSRIRGPPGAGGGPGAISHERNALSSRDLASQYFRRCGA